MSVTNPLQDRDFTLVFFVRDKQILLAMKKRGFGTGKWNGAGGKVEPGETAEQAMIRESQEEVGLTPTAWRKVALHDFYMAIDTPDSWRTYAHVFICTEWQGIPIETEEMAPKWFNIKSIPYDTMWSDDMLWLPLVLQGKNLRCIFEFNADDSLASANLRVVADFTTK